jgi:hypothetical protein
MSSFCERTMRVGIATSRSLESEAVRRPDKRATADAAAETRAAKGQRFSQELHCHNLDFDLSRTWPVGTGAAAGGGCLLVYGNKDFSTGLDCQKADFSVVKTFQGLE